jgi:hypothetical protein
MGEERVFEREEGGREGGSGGGRRKVKRDEPPPSPPHPTSLSTDIPTVGLATSHV